MSVINKMLKDLEQNSPTQNNTNVMLKKERGNQLLIRVIIFLLLSVIIILGAKIYLPENSGNPSNAKITIKQNQMVAEEVAVPKVETIGNKKTTIPSRATLSMKKQASIIPQKAVTKKQLPLTKTEMNKHSENENLTERKSAAVKQSQQVRVEALAKVSLKKPMTKIDPKKIAINRKPAHGTTTFNIRKQKLDPEKQARQLWKKAELEPRQAEKYLQKALLLDADLHGARLQLIALQVSKRNLSEAEISVNQGLLLFNNDVRYIEWKARLLLAFDKKQQAKLWLLKSTPQLKTHINYYGLLAGIESQLGEYQPARDIYQKLVNAQPGHGPWLLGLALTQQKLGNNDAAKISYVQATTGDGLSSRAREFIQQQITRLEH